MDYTEIKERLTACEIKLQALQNSNQDVKNTQQYNMAVKKLTVLKESLQKRLKEADAKGVVQTKDLAKAKELADKGVNVELSEEESALNKFSDYSNNELIAYIKNTNDSEAKKELHKRTQNLKKLTRDDVEESMDINDPVMMKLRAAKMKRASSQSQTSSKGSSNDAKIAALKKRRAELMRDMEQEAEPEGGPIADEYGEKLNKIDKAIAKLSGQGEWGSETNLYMDKDEIERRAATLGESMSDEEWSDAAEAERLVNHPERSTIEKIKALIASQQKKKEDEEPDDENIPAIDRMYNSDAWVQAQRDMLDEASEGMYYIEVSVRDARKALAIVDDQPALKKAVQMNGSTVYYLADEGLAYDLMMDFGAQGIEVIDTNIEDEDDMLDEASEGLSYIEVSVRDARKAMDIMDDRYRGQFKMNGSNVYYFKDDSIAYDAMMDFGAQGIEVIDTNIELEEASDYAKRRAAERDYQPAKKDKPAKPFKEPKNDYFARRKAEMQEEVEEVDKLAAKIQKALNNKLIDKKTASEMRKALQRGDLNVVKAADLEEASDYAKRRAAEIDDEDLYEGDINTEMDGGDLDVGHQDDEPSMLKKDLYDIITYASKLYKQMDKYDQYDGEVDFPHWWQAKVVKARDFMSAAQHYLESEEKQPAIDQLALQEGYAGPSIDKMSRQDMIDFLNVSPKVVKNMSNKDLRDAVIDKNSDMNEKTDYQKRREAESDYKPSKRDVPPKKYREPKNDYFARRKAEMDEALNPEVTKSLDQFIKSIAKRYDYSEQDAVYAIMQALRQTSFKGINEGTDLYDRNGIQITRFSGGSKGVMVQISYGGKYIHVPASEYPFLVRAMQSAKEDLKDMSRQLPRGKNMEEASQGKIQKDYDALVAKMKELAKLYKSGDTSVVGQLKDMTAKKKELEKKLDKAVSKIGVGQEYSDSVDENAKTEGEMAAAKGKLYSDNPYKKGSKEHLDWSKGHNSSRARKGSMNEVGPEAAMSIADVLATGASLGAAGTAIYQVFKKFVDPTTGELDSKKLLDFFKKSGSTDKQ